MDSISYPRKEVVWTKLKEMDEKEQRMLIARITSLAQSMASLNSRIRLIEKKLEIGMTFTKGDEFICLEKFSVFNTLSKEAYEIEPMSPIVFLEYKDKNSIVAFFGEQELSFSLSEFESLIFSGIVVPCEKAKEK